MDIWTMLFLVCFLVGVFFVAISFIMGSFGEHHMEVTHHAGHFGSGGHGSHAADVGHAAHSHLGESGDTSDFATGQHGQHEHAVTKAASPSVFNLNSIMIFLTCFGGIGFILRSYSGLALFAVLVAAVLAGIAGGALVFYFLARVIYPNVGRERFTTQHELPGTIATVTSGIQMNGVGEIVYSKGGTRHTDGARSIDGTAIPRSTEVVIVKFENGLAYVQQFDTFMAASEDRKRLTPPGGQQVPDAPQRVRNNRSE